MNRLEQDGVRWELQPDFQPLLQAVLQSPGRVVKESPAKLVTAHTLDGTTYFVKRYRNDAVPLRPLKYFFKHSQAREEWELSQQLDALAIPIVRHLALGERWTATGLQEAILITEGFAGTGLDEAKNLDLDALLEFLDRMHRQGVVHRDLHPQNLLVRAEPFEMRLVDLHGIVVRNEIGEEERADMLAFLKIFLPLPVSGEIEQRGLEMRKKAFAARARRCLKRNRDFAPETFGALRWQTRQPSLNAAVEKILRDPDGFLREEAALLKDGRSSTVGAAHGLVLKRYNFRKALNPLKDLFRQSRARGSFLKAYHLELAGIPTARVIACAEERCAGLVRRGFFLMEEIPGAVELPKWRGDKRTAARSIADLVARLHHEGFSHRDLKETNILLDPDGQAWLIDLEGLNFEHTVSPERAAADLMRLDRGAVQLRDFGPSDRMNFLRHYCRVRKIRPRDIFARPQGMARRAAPE